MKGMIKRGEVSNSTFLIVWLGLGIVLGSLTGCGGGTTANTPPSSGATLNSVAVTPTTSSVAVGATQQFKATGTYSDNSTQDVTGSAAWSSSDATKATIQTTGQTNPGMATAVAAGSTTITATLSGKSGAASLTVTSSSATLTSISVTPTTASVAVGATQQFTATGTYSDGSTQNITQTATWTSSDATKATIQSTGLATGVAAGSVTITAALSGKSGTATLTVTSSSGATLTSIAVSPTSVSIAVGATQQFFATGTYSDGTQKDITATSTWTSSDTTKATIQSTGQPNPGLATGVAAGSASITAALNGKSGSTTLTITSSSGNATKIPIMDMTSSQNYLSFQGGLYENSSDTVPADHDAAGLATAAAIQPLDTNGNPSSSGKIAFVSIGMSNAMGEFAAFMGQAAANSGVNHTTLVIANGALSGDSACMWIAATGPPACNPTLGNQYDRVRDSVLAPLGLTEKQVEIAWIKEANPNPGTSGWLSLCDPATAGCSNSVSTTEGLRYEQQLGEIIRAAKTRWPNLKQAFLASRIYGGYATSTLNPEPYAYEYGFSLKWLIEAQIVQIRTGTVDSTAGDLNYNNNIAPWTAWGPYLWANGATPRSDGLVWCNGQAGSPCNGEVDFNADGTHPDTLGEEKVATLLMNFFLASTYTAWFRP